MEALEILVILLSVFLAIFLVLAIALTIQLLKLARRVEDVSDKAGTFFKSLSPTVIASIAQYVRRSKKRKNNGKEED